MGGRGVAKVSLRQLNIVNPVTKYGFHEALYKNSIEELWECRRGDVGLRQSARYFQPR